MAPNATDPQEQGAATPLDRDLADLERRLAQDLTCLCLPPVNWVPARTHDGQEVADVVIIGGGMCGLVEWLGLQASGVRNVRILDRGPKRAARAPGKPMRGWKPCDRPSN